MCVCVCVSVGTLKYRIISSMRKCQNHLIYIILSFCIRSYHQILKYSHVFDVDSFIIYHDDDDDDDADEVEDDAMLRAESLELGVWSGCI